MYLRSLYVHNFRNYDEAFIEFVPEINTLCGPNARGKTSLLEAIYFLIAGRSFRMAQTSDLIRKQSSYFYIEAAFIKNDLDQRLKISCDGRDRKIVYNSTLYPSTASLLGLLKGVVICPDDAALVKGAPAVRRHYLDLQIAQVDPFYVHQLTRYQRAMKQRNHLLRAKKASSIESWEYEMARAGAYITFQRAVAVRDLLAEGQILHALLTGETTHFELRYQTSAPNPDSENELMQYYLQQYGRLRRREMEVGFTLTGPHKDDVVLEIDHKEARYFASEGQQQSCVAVLRLAEWRRMKRVGDDIPLLLIDDVGTSLDENRRGKLLECVKTFGQVFLTTTHTLPVSSHVILL